jgi:serine/threonine protein kinase
MPDTSRIPLDATALAPLADRYEILQLLGHGIFGDVFLALQRTLGRRVALKVLVSPENDAPERFLRESRAMSRLRHPNVADILDCGNCGDLLYIAMEFVEGESLEATLLRERQLAGARVTQLARGLLNALEALHANGLLHRDLKPANILLAAHGPKLIDLGMAYHDSWARLTQTGYTVGTPLYMAPEQLIGDALDERTDLYALGLVLYEALYGERYCTADSVPLLIEARMNAPALKLPANPRIADQLGLLLIALLERHPQRRPASATDALRLLSGPVLQTPVPVGRPTLRLHAPARRPVWPVLVLAILCFVLVTWQNRTVPPPSRTLPPVARLEVDDLVSIPSAASFLVDFVFRGPDPRELILEGIAPPHPVRIYPLNVLPGRRVHCVIRGLAPDTVYTFTIRGQNASGGLKNHWVRTLSAKQASDHRTVLSLFNSGSWASNAVLLSLSSMSADPDPDYLDSIRAKLLATPTFEGYTMSLVARVLASLRDWTTFQHWFPVLPRAESLGPTVHARMVQYLGESGDRRAVEPARKIIRERLLRQVQSSWGAILAIVARHGTMEDARLIMKQVDRGELTVDEPLLGALYRLDRQGTIRWLRTSGTPETRVMRLCAVVDPGPVELEALEAAARRDPTNQPNIAGLLPLVGPIARPLAAKLLRANPTNSSCIRAVGVLGALDAGEHLRSTLTDRAAPLASRAEAALALGLLEDRRWAPDLRQFLPTGPPHLTRACTWALGKLRDEKALPLLMQLAENTQDDTDVSLWSIGRIAAPESRPLLCKTIATLSGVRDPGAGTRLALAVWALSQLRSVADAPLFRKLLATTSDRFVRRQAEKALGLIPTLPYQIECFLFPFMLWDRPGLEVDAEDEVQVETYGAWGYREKASGKFVPGRAEGKSPAGIDYRDVGVRIGYQLLDPALPRSASFSPPTLARSEVLLLTLKPHHLAGDLTLTNWIGAMEVVLPRRR